MSQLNNVHVPVGQGLRARSTIPAKRALQRPVRVESMVSSHAITCADALAVGRYCKRPSPRCRKKTGSRSRRWE